MSADLLAEFEPVSQPPSHTTQPQQQSFQLPAPDDADDDAWGDFEVAPSSTPTVNPLGSTTSASSVLEPPPRSRIVRASTFDLVANNIPDTPPMPTTPSFPQTSPAPRPQTPPRARGNIASNKAVGRDPNVLFDADDFDGAEDEGDDDFGDFETGVPEPSAASFDLLALETSASAASVPNTSASADLFSGLTLQDPPSSYPQPPRSPSFQERNPFPGLALNTPPKTNSTKTNQERKPQKGDTPLTAWPSGDQSAGPGNIDDGWGSFEDAPQDPPKLEATIGNGDTSGDWDWDSISPAVSKPKAPKPKKATEKAPPPAAPDTMDSSWDWDSIDVKPASDVQKSAPEDDMPPINIPPPSVLLSIFPQLIGEANAKLFKPIGGQSFSIKNRILSDPKTLEFLRGYLILATVAARVIAGRKLRWHRDKFLAQGMSISAAGSKGMKLAGVDKAQTARESREAGDVVDVWKEHVGRLRSAVAAANSSVKDKAGQLKVPEIGENMAVQTAKLAPTAPKACLICGLKREERISKVDYEIEDSFGEWWADHWGHTTCKRFWLQHESALRSR